MMFPLVRDLADDGVPVAVTCRVLGFSKQAFFKWRRQPVTDRDWSDAHLINAAIDIHHDDPEFGYRFITDELAEAGIVAGRKRVNRLCTSQRLWSVHSRKRGLNRRPGPPVHEDLVERQFHAARPDELWLTDITEHPTSEGKLYLAAIKDACSNRIVGYSMNERMTSQLAVDALTNACSLRRPTGTTVHSDRGSQGGFNWPSQHLVPEVDAWSVVLVRSRHALGRIGGRSRRRVRRRWPGARVGSSFGLRSLAAPGPRTHAGKRACRDRSGSAGFATLAA